MAAVGRLRERPLRQVADDYLGRIRRYVRCDEHELRDGAALGRAMPEAALRVALEVKGETLSSPELALRLERWGATGKGVIGFLVGGAEGLPRPISRAAAVRLSLSPLTLPHRLARIVLYEQIYRALSTLRGEPYARED